MAKIIMRITTREVDLREVEVTDEFLTPLIRESRWQLGISQVAGIEVPCERRLSLGEFEYRMKGQILSTRPETFMPTEYMEWRDG